MMNCQLNMTNTANTRKTAGFGAGIRSTQLLGQIMGETEAEAALELETIEAERIREERQLIEQSVTEKQRREASAEAALPRERERRARAQAKREAILEAIAAESRPAPVITSTAAPASTTGDFTAAVYTARGTAEFPVTKTARLARWVFAVASAAAVALAALMIGQSGAAISDTTYPKFEVALQSSETQIEYLAMATVPTAEPATVVTADANDEPRRRSRRDRTTPATNDTPPEAAPERTRLSIDLDADNLFDRGSE